MKLSKKKIIVITIIILLATISIVVGVAFFKTYQRNEAIKKVIGFVENEQMEKALDVVNEDLGENDEEALKTQLKEYIESMENEFIEGNLEYTIAETRIAEIEKMNLFEEDEFSEIHERMKTINESNVCFINGQESLNNKQYANALRDLKKVIKEDRNYEAAQSMIETTIASYKEEIKKDVEELIEKKSYEDAFSLLEEGLGILENDTDFSALMSKYKDEYVADEVKQATSLAEEEKYEDAIKILKDAGGFVESEEFTKEIDKIKEKYANWALAKAKEMAEQWQYDEAIRFLTNVNQTVNLDSIESTIEEYSQHQKVEFYDMTIIDSDNIEFMDGAVLDTFGNEYTNAYKYWYESAFSLHNIKGSYRRFTAVVAPSKTMDSNCSVYFEFYGGNNKNDLKLIGKTSQFTRTSEAIPVEVDVTGCKVFEVRMYRTEGYTSDCFLTNAYLQ